MLRGQGALTERTSSAPACGGGSAGRLPRRPATHDPPRLQRRHRPQTCAGPCPCLRPNPIGPFRHLALPTRATGMWSPPASTTRETTEIRDECAGEENSIFATPDLDSKHVKIPDFRVFLGRFAPCFFTHLLKPHRS
jgi:hypothetical protein